MAFEEVRNEGIQQGADKKQISDLRNLMKNLNLSVQQAMDALSVPKEDQAKYAAML